jgi:hypothetical protein
MPCTCNSFFRALIDALLSSVLLYKALYSEYNSLMTYLQAACISAEGSILGRDVWEILMFPIQSYEGYNVCVTNRGAPNAEKLFT